VQSVARISGLGRAEEGRGGERALGLSSMVGMLWRRMGPIQADNIPWRYQSSVRAVDDDRWELLVVRHGGKLKAFFRRGGMALWMGIVRSAPSLALRRRRRSTD